MASLFSDEILSEIRARVSIAEVIAPYVALRKAGRNHLGLCPFHNENTPSFSVNDERGFFHCFGCGVSGNAFTFLVRLDGISFPEAVRRLAAKAGVPLPQTPQDPEAQERARLFRLN
ncbi:MAG: CHC2 zinc finger domain-containing protein, partial [Candidatus Omnitrophota bacterium]